MEEPDQTDGRVGDHKSPAVAPVRPLDVSGVRTIAVGTGLWLLAVCVLLAFYAQLAQGGDLWWLWTCCAGAGLGVVGWLHCLRRARRNPTEQPGQPD